MRFCSHAEVDNRQDNDRLVKRGRKVTLMLANEIEQILSAVYVWSSEERDRVLIKVARAVRMKNFDR